MRDRHPRTAMGLSRDKQTFLLVVVDGRSGRSSGMYGTELAALMDKLGAWTALNLDGGGSSQMWVDGDGRADVCARGPDGFRCHMSRGNRVSGPSRVLELSDGSGWDDRDNYATLRMGDVDGDGRADACIRGKEGVECRLATNDRFGARFGGPGLRVPPRSAGGRADRDAAGGRRRVVGATPVYSSLSCGSSCGNRSVVTIS